MLRDRATTLAPARAALSNPTFSKDSRMYAILQQSGHQYRVSPGDRLVVDRLTAEVGSVVALEPVVLVQGDDGTQVGTPVVEGVRVAAVVVGNSKGGKIRVFKYKPKKRYRRTHGHRSLLTELRVEAVLAPGEKLPEPKPAAAKAEKAEAKPAAGRARGKAKAEAESPAAVETAAVETEAAATEAPAATTPKRGKAATAKAAAAEAVEAPEAEGAQGAAVPEAAAEESAPKKRTRARKAESAETEKTPATDGETEA